MIVWKLCILSIIWIHFWVVIVTGMAVLFFFTRKGSSYSVLGHDIFIDSTN